MTNMNEEAVALFIKELELEYEEHQKFLEDHGWIKSEKYPKQDFWVSPKGEELDQFSAFTKAQHDIVINYGFIYFEVQIFNDKKRPKNLRGSSQPFDEFYPYVKDGKIFHYKDALSTAMGIDTSLNPFWSSYTRWRSLVDMLEKEVKICEIKHKEIIKVIELCDHNNQTYEFHIKFN